MFNIKSLKEFCFLWDLGVETLNVFLRFIWNTSYSAFAAVLFLCFDFLKDFLDAFLIPWRDLGIYKFLGKILLTLSNGVNWSTYGSESDPESS